MTKKKDKFFVGINFRKNKLAEKETSIIAEVHDPRKPTKSYTNIHYPKALARKIFKSTPSVTHVTIINTNDGSNYEIKND